MPPRNADRPFRARRLVMAALALSAAALAGCTWIAGRPQQIGRTLVDYRYPSEPVGSPGFEAALDRYTDSAARPGNAAKLLQNGDQAYPVMLGLIRGAKRRISMETYIVDSDATTDLFFHALAEAAARGVEVRFLADAAGFRRGVVADLDELVRQGVQARIFNPLLLSWTVLRGNNRDHRKILVVDGRHAVLGGLNISNDQLGDGVTGWRDTALWLDGPAAADAERVFAENWNQAGRRYLGRDLPVVGINELKRAVDEPWLRLSEQGGADPRFDPPDGDDEPSPDATDATGPTVPIPPVTLNGSPAHPDKPLALSPGDLAALYAPQARDVSVRVVSSKPDAWNCPTYDLAILGLWGAREKVDIACAYFVPPLSLKRAILAAARRGVRVRLLVPERTDVRFVRELGASSYGELMAGGVEIYEWPHLILHAKTMVVDGRWLVVGSGNMDSRSYFLNYEANLAVADPTLAGIAHEVFEADLLHSKRLTPEAHRARGTKQEMIEVLMRPLAGQY